MHVKLDMSIPLNINMAPAGNILAVRLPSFQAPCFAENMYGEKKKKKRDRKANSHTHTEQSK